VTTLPDKTRAVREMLRADSRFEDVANARRLYTENEYEDVPGVVHLRYADRGFFVRVSGDLAVVERAGGGHQRIGEVGTINVVPKEFCDGIAAVIKHDLAPPIAIGPHGERVLPPAGSEDGDELRSSLHHDVCGGTVYRRRVTELSQALYCQSCGLRVVIPVEVRTWGDLRKWAAERHVRDVVEMFSR